MALSRAQCSGIHSSTAIDGGAAASEAVVVGGMEAPDCCGAEDADFFSPSFDDEDGDDDEDEGEPTTTGGAGAGGTAL